MVLNLLQIWDETWIKFEKQKQKLRYTYIIVSLQSLIKALYNWSKQVQFKVNREYILTWIMWMIVPLTVVFSFQEQRRRYTEIKQSDMPMAIAAKRTREFRCPPQEQVDDDFYY